MLNRQKTARGFTIVELLIVIVVIAILAAISIVAYNGVQARGKTSAAASAAASLDKKMEIYNAVNSQYPNVAGTITCTSTGAACGTQNSVATTTSSDWYSPYAATMALNGVAASAMAAPTNVNTLWYFPSGTVGGCIYYWDFQQSKAVPVTVGAPTTACAATPNTSGTFPLTTTTTVGV